MHSEQADGAHCCACGCYCLLNQLLDYVELLLYTSVLILDIFQLDFLFPEFKTIDEKCKMDESIQIINATRTLFPFVL